MERPKVGVGVLIIKDGKLLLGKRLSESHGTGTWQFPGGHLEGGESLEDCAKREVLEETGIGIRNVRFATATNDIFPEGKHYITMFVLADWESGEPKPMEPEKAMEWSWHKWDELPGPRFLPLDNLLGQGFRPEGL